MSDPLSKLNKHEITPEFVSKIVKNYILPMFDAH